MSANVPELVDVWRMVAARRGFEGRLPLSSLDRLKGLLSDPEGEAGFALQFDRDDTLQVSYAELRIDAGLPLVCQRSLERFVLPVQIVQRLGLVRSEDEEAALPEEYEALLVPEDGMLGLASLVEDELILAVPVVPMSPDKEAVDRDWQPGKEELAQANPFSALAAMKKKN